MKNPNYTIKANEQYKSNEIYFDNKPAKETLEAIKALHMRWNNTKKCWYGFATIEAIEKACGNVQAEPTKQEETSEKLSGLAPIKFYYNGLKVGNGDLIKCYYYSDDNFVYITAKGYASLPRDYFEVENETDLYTDYFDNDSAKLAKDHPFYQAVKMAELANKIHDYKSTISRYEKKGGRWLSFLGCKSVEECKNKLAEMEKEYKNIQPTNSDLLKIESMKFEEENARLEAKQAEEQKRREEYLNMRCNAMRFTEEATKNYPVEETKPYVIINWSEHPGIEENTKLSFMAADELLYKLDCEVPENRGYFKTSFEIYENNKKVYDGRYDLGDHDGGLYQHIKSWLEWNTKHDCFGHNYTDILTIEQTKRINEYKEALKWLDTLVTA